MIEIPIVKDLNSNEGTECFIVHLSTVSVMSDDVAISLGEFREATVCIQDEIIISFHKRDAQMKEGENLTLIVTATTVSDKNYTININITSNTANCKLKVLTIDHNL